MLTPTASSALHIRRVLLGIHLVLTLLLIASWRWIAAAQTSRGAFLLYFLAIVLLAGFSWWRLVQHRWLVWAITQCTEPRKLKRLCRGAGILAHNSDYYRKRYQARSSREEQAFYDISTVDERLADKDNPLQAETLCLSPLDQSVEKFKSIAVYAVPLLLGLLLAFFYRDRLEKGALLFLTLTVIGFLGKAIHNINRKYRKPAYREVQFGRNGIQLDDFFVDWAMVDQASIRANGLGRASYLRLQTKNGEVANYDLSDFLVKRSRLNDQIAVYRLRAAVDQGCLL